jgi:hypothetical protein
MKQSDDRSSLWTMYSLIFTKSYETFLSSLYIYKMILGDNLYVVWYMWKYIEGI